MDYCEMRDQRRQRLEPANLNAPHLWLTLLAVARTTELAGRDLGPATFAWARYAAEVHDTMSALMRPSVVDSGLNEVPAPKLPGDSPELRGAAMRLCRAVAQVFAEAATSELEPSLRDAHIQVAAALTAAAARLRPT